MERWGFKAPKNKEISHLCAMLVTEKATGKIGHPINHTLLEGGDVTHYDVEFDDVIIEGMPVGALDVEVQEEHQHGRREDYAHDEEKPRAQYAEVVSEEEEEMPEQPSDKMSAGDFKTKSIEQAKVGSESGMDPKENAIISQLIDILKVAAKEGNITSGNINTLLNKVAAEAKKIS